MKEHANRIKEFEDKTNRIEQKLNSVLNNINKPNNNDNIEKIDNIENIVVYKIYIQNSFINNQKNKFIKYDEILAELTQNQSYYFNLMKNKIDNNEFNEYKNDIDNNISQIENNCVEVF